MSRAASLASMTGPRRGVWLGFDRLDHPTAFALVHRFFPVGSGVWAKHSLRTPYTVVGPTRVTRHGPPNRSGKRASRTVVLVEVEGESGRRFNFHPTSLLQDYDGKPVTGGWRDLQAIDDEDLEP